MRSVDELPGWAKSGLWVIAHPKFSILIGLITFAFILMLCLALMTPRHDRDWADNVARLAEVRRTGDAITVDNYRTWSYDGHGPTDTSYRTTNPFEIGDIAQIWFVLEPHPGIPGMAHTMIVFEFADQHLLGLSVEARKEAGEPYGLVHGTLNGFELIYVWASPKDLFTRRVLVQEHEIYMYPLALSQGEAEAYLGALLAKTEAIEARPRFYNTFTSNCTNELGKTGGLNWHPAFVFTGFSAKALFDQDRIVGEGSYGEIKARANITETIRGLSGESNEDFNAGLIKRLKQD